MNKFKFILVGFILFLSACALISQNKTGTSKKIIDEKKISAHEKYEKAKTEADNIRNNQRYYVGESVAKITDYQETRKKARNEALKDLSSRIEITVKVDIENILSNTSISSANQYSEDEKNTIVKKSKIYAEHVISNYQINYYDDFPKDSLITCLTWISKKDYQEKVKEDLNNNKKMIRETILAGNNNFISGNYLAVVYNWIEAKKLLKEIFDNLPLQDDIDGNGEKVEVNSYLNNKVVNLFDRVRLSIDSDELFTYDVTGNLNKFPIVYAKYVDKNDSSSPFAKLPLTADYIEGKGKILGDIITADYGQVELPIRNLIASSPIIRLRVKIDKTKIKGLNLFTLPELSSVIIKMKKMKTIALSVTFINNGEISTPTSLYQTINSYILDKSFSVSELKIRKNMLSANDFEDINKSNTDYFMNIFIKTSSTSSVGGYENIFKASCSGSVALYKLPQGNKISLKPIKNSQGFGSSAANAGVNAYGKIIAPIESTVQEILNKIN